jgi:hypothetical protein
MTFELFWRQWNHSRQAHQILVLRCISMDSIEPCCLRDASRMARNACWRRSWAWQDNRARKRISEVAEGTMNRCQSCRSKDSLNHVRYITWKWCGLIYMYVINQNCENLEKRVPFSFRQAAYHLYSNQLLMLCLKWLQPRFFFRRYHAVRAWDSLLSSTRHFKPLRPSYASISYSHEWGVIDRVTNDWNSHR